MRPSKLEGKFFWSMNLNLFTIAFPAPRMVPGTYRYQKSAFLKWLIEWKIKYQKSEILQVIHKSTDMQYMHGSILYWTCMDMMKTLFSQTLSHLGKQTVSRVYENTLLHPRPNVILQTCNIVIQYVFKTNIEKNDSFRIYSNLKDVHG